MLKKRLLAVALVLALTGCATLNTTWEALKKAWAEASVPVPVPVPKPEPPGPDPCPGCGPEPPNKAYVVEPGKRTMQPATALSFSVLFSRDGSAENEDVVLFACADEMCDTWNGGNSSTFGVRVNAYNSGRWKMKVYGLSGYCGEPTVDQPWKAGVEAKVKLEVLPGRVRLTVNDAPPIEQPCATPDRPTIGYGWPPSVRQGALGAKIYDVVRTEWRP